MSSLQNQPIESSNPWIQSLECLSILGMAFNLGITSSASLITVPTLSKIAVPARHRAYQFVTFCSRSEHIVPPSNALCFLASIVLGIKVHRSASSDAAARKLRFIKATIALLASVTAYSLMVMVPMNSGMKGCQRKLREVASLENQQGVKRVERDFNGLLERWRRLNLVRMTLMAMAAACSVSTLARHGSAAALVRKGVGR